MPPVELPSIGHLAARAFETISYERVRCTLQTDGGWKLNYSIISLEESAFATVLTDWLVTFREAVKPLEVKSLDMTLHRTGTPVRFSNSDCCIAAEAWARFASNISALLCERATRPSEGTLLLHMRDIDGTDWDSIEFGYGYLQDEWDLFNDLSRELKALRQSLGLWSEGQGPIFVSFTLNKGSIGLRSIE
jgi:hypothetical protein